MSSKLCAKVFFEKARVNVRSIVVYVMKNKRAEKKNWRLNKLIFDGLDEPTVV